MSFTLRFTYGCLLFLIGQILVWYQINGQFLSEWSKKHPLIMSLFGFPISYVYIYATHHLVLAYDGQLWPQRLIGFAMGMVAFSFLTWFHLNEVLTVKTTLTLILALAIVLIQIFWK